MINKNNILISRPIEVIGKTTAQKIIAVSIYCLSFLVGISVLIIVFSNEPSMKNLRIIELAFMNIFFFFPMFVLLTYCFLTGFFTSVHVFSKSISLNQIFRKNIIEYSNITNIELIERPKKLLNKFILTVYYKKNSSDSEKEYFRLQSSGTDKKDILRLKEIIEQNTNLNK